MPNIVRGPKIGEQVRHTDSKLAKTTWVFGAFDTDLKISVVVKV
jgi:hypothetical protein